MTDIDKDLNEILTDLAEDYYPEHEYNDMWRERNAEQVTEAIAKIKALVVEAEYKLLNETMLKWHDCNDGEYAMYFKNKGDELLEQKSILRGD